MNGFTASIKNNRNKLCLNNVIKILEHQNFKIIASALISPSNKL